MLKSLSRMMVLGLLVSGIGISAASALPKPGDPGASFGVGFYGQSATVKFWLNNDMSLQFGGHIITSSAAGASTEIDLGTAFQFSPGAISKNVLQHWTGFLQYSLNNGQANGVNTLTLGAGWGVDAIVAPHCTVGFDIALVQLNSTSGGGANQTNFSFFTPLISSHYYF